MKLVIAEKNEVARDIARALIGQAPGGLPAEGGGWAICGASGHLLALREPGDVDERYRRTEPDDLPIEIYPWPNEAPGEYQEKKLAEIGRLLKQSPEKIYHAGDADDEGQLIVDEILEWFGVDPSAERVWRVYINDNTDANIRRAFEKAIPNSKCVKDGLAAKARSLGDFCFGVNESRLASAKLKTRVSVGRVQTPTLGLVVQRDLAREGHVKQEYYELSAETLSDRGSIACSWRFKPTAEHLEDGRHCLDKGFLQEVADKVDGAKFEADIRVSHRKQESPLPYNFTDLTADMSKRYKMTANDVMEATQTLREKYKAITYNRAESRHLPEELYGEAPRTSRIVAGNIGWDGGIDTTRKHPAFNDGKVGAHHGIVPQATKVDTGSMPERERRVYEAVATRYLCMFAADVEYDSAEGTWSPDGCDGAFSYKACKVTSPGWSAFAPKAWTNIANQAEDICGAGMQGFKVETCGTTAKETTPPPAFTDGTLMVAMSNIAKYVKDPETKRLLIEKDERSTTDHGSIGTVATRKDIIERLVEKGFIERDKDKLVSTRKGRKFYELVPEEISGADLTAKWYLIQKDVADGKAQVSAVMKSVCEEFMRHKDTAYEGASLKTTVGTCPRCGSKVEKRGSVYACESVKSEKKADGTWEEVAGCGFKVFPFCGKKLTEKQAARLLEGKDVPLKGCVSKKTGKKFDCKVRLNANSELEPVFDEKKPKGGKKGYVNRAARGRSRF